MSLFSKTLKKHSLTEDDLSHKLKIKVKRYNNYASAIAEEKIKLSQAKTAKARTDSEQAIREGEENLARLDQEIVDGIEYNVKNKDVNEKRKAALAKGRQTRLDNKGVDPAEQKPAGTEGAAQPAKNDEPAAAKGTAENPLELETEEVHELPATVEKKKSGAGIFAAIGALVVVGVLGYFGIKASKKQ